MKVSIDYYRYQNVSKFDKEGASLPYQIFVCFCSPFHSYMTKMYAFFQPNVHIVFEDMEFITLSILRRDLQRRLTAQIIKNIMLYKSQKESVEDWMLN